VHVTVRGDTAGNRFIASAAPGSATNPSVVRAPMTEWDQQFVSVPITPHVALGAPADAARSGLTITTAPGPVPTLCHDLRS